MRAEAVAVLSGFLAILPALSSWVIWVPAALILVLQKRFYDAMLVAGVHLAASFYLDPILYSFIPGANSVRPMLAALFSTAD